jgi:hypothetical protein
VLKAVERCLGPIGDAGEDETDPEQLRIDG